MENILFSPRHRLDEDAERELGRRLEALWDEQKEPSLSDTQRLNSCLEKIPVSSFPAPPDKQVVEINSDASLAEAVQLLAKHKILSSPVRDINAPEDATWIDKYIGIVEFAGIAVWLLQQSEAFGINSGSEAAMGGDFFEMLTSSEFYRETKLIEDQPVLQAFKLMSEKRVGGLPIIEKEGNKVVGNISLRDIQFLLMAPEIYEEFRSVTAKAFCTAVRSHLRLKQEASPLLEDVITCQKTDTIEKVILKLDNARIQRIYVVNSHGDLEGVVTLRDIISTFVQEPPGYFGDFFYQVVPLPINSSV
ncbi:SNF1-related protein kinase regulatory subunit gamma-1 isoform X3 [Cryptomeria japonica]|uniref:SNF1-related protein kinase regulatory subunit gamma-1 isoform X3 n=1 Tax=Cryptomeria japonica TaxID=3369 RepID=UPI0025ABFFAD|nr:SNF1-related protein kinase regulatory subunit gamma-1 isoform X3 [Cryptomeria japonica]